jgi:8-oxo-dGTP diphosphatase
MAYTYKYPRPAVTADCIVITREAEPKAASKQEQRDACIDTAEREQARATPKVLLIQRGFDPYKGCWAFSGGFMNMDETTEQCAIRELEEETGLKVTNIHQIGAYSKVDRDPRGRTITVAYLAIVDEPIAVTGQDDAAKAEWFPLSALPELAFDHADIMQDAIRLYHQIENPLLHG